MANTFTSGYTDRKGINSRAHSALFRITEVIDAVTIPPAVRLALIAEIMAGEPILTDQSPAAHAVRAEARSYGDRY